MTNPERDAPEQISSADNVADVGLLARGSMLSFAGTIAKAVLGFALVFLITRQLGARGAGLFFQAIAIFTIAEAARMGADTGLVRSISRMRTLGRVEDIRPTIKVAVAPVIVLTTGIAAIAFAYAPALAEILFEGDVASGTDAIRLLSLFLPLAAVSDVLLGGTRGFGTVLPYVAVESFGKPLLRPFLVIVAFALGSSTLGALTAWAIPIAVGLPIAVWWIVALSRNAERSIPTLPRPTPWQALTNQFWRFSIPQGISSILLTATRWLGIPLVGALRSVSEAGVFAAVNRTALFGLFAIDALRIAIAPQISALLTAGDHDRAQGVYRVATAWLVLLSWPIYVALAVWSPVVLRIFGPGFESGQTALLISSLGMMLFTATGNVTTVLLMGGRSGSVLINTTAALVANVTLTFLLVPSMGIDGAAVAWVVGIATGELLALAAVHRHLRIGPFGRGFALVALWSTACFGVIGAMMRSALGESIPAMLAAILVGLTLYGLILFRDRSTLELVALWDVVFRRNPSDRGSMRTTGEAADR